MFVLIIVIALWPVVRSDHVAGLIGQTVILPSVLITAEDMTQITWQRRTLSKPHNDNFLTVTQYGPLLVGADDGHRPPELYRFAFVGDIRKGNGTIRLSNLTLGDDGIYKCIYTLFPSGSTPRFVNLTVNAFPINYIRDEIPVTRDEKSPLVTCVALGAKPPVTVEWVVDQDHFYSLNNSTLHPNGTTDTLSTLWGVPRVNLTGRVVRCVIKNAIFQERLEFPLVIRSPPESVIISERQRGTFECTSDVHPRPHFIWSSLDRDWPSGIEVLPNGTGSLIQITDHVGDDISGLYQCYAYNSLGSRSAYLYIDVSREYYNSPVCWTLFGLLCSAMCLSVTLWCCATDLVRVLCDIRRFQL